MTYASLLTSSLCPKQNQSSDASREKSVQTTSLNQRQLPPLWGLDSPGSPRSLIYDESHCLRPLCVGAGESSGRGVTRIAGLSSPAASKPPSQLR